MKPSPQELALGAKTARDVRFYEKYTERSMPFTPWVWALCAALMIVFVMDSSSKRHDYMIWVALIPVGFTLMLRQNHLARTRHESDKMLLRLLEEKYGDALPWVMDEKQLKSARELEAKIAGQQHAV